MISPEREVVKLDSADRSAWDRFVEKHPRGLICHTSAWQSVLEQSFDHIRGRTFVMRDASDGVIRAGLPLYDVTSRLTGRRLVGIPFATLCDPLVDTPSEMDLLLDAAMELYQQRHLSYIELRTRSAGNLIDPERMVRTDTFKLHSLALDVPPNELLKRFHRSCVRQPIQRALKGDLSCVTPASHEQFMACYDLYVMNRRRLGLPTQPLHYFRNLWETFAPSGRVQLLLAEDRGHPVACLMLLRYRNRVSAEFLAHDKAHATSCPTHFLFWHAICSAHADGYEIFDFGRTAVSNPSLLAFKRRWGTQEEDLPVFWYPARAALKPPEMGGGWRYGLAQAVIRNSPKQAAKKFSEFCYHHLG